MTKTWRYFLLIGMPALGLLSGCGKDDYAVNVVDYNGTWSNCSRTSAALSTKTGFTFSGWLVSSFTNTYSDGTCIQQVSGISTDFKATLGDLDSPAAGARKFDLTEIRNSSCTASCVISLARVDKKNLGIYRIEADTLFIALSTADNPAESDRPNLFGSSFAREK